MDMLFSLSPQHVQLVAACYPPSASLLSTATEYKPNSQELSRLTYFASNRPGKIAKLSGELQKRAIADVRKARSGNARARATLLVTLNIFKALITECRRDISLLSASLMASLDATLAALSSDLEIVAKAATVFTAWTTYTTGQLLGLDAAVTRDYVSTLKRFAALCCVEAKGNDLEMRNRTRLIGLGALTGSISSEALYNSSTQFKTQVATIVPALYLNVQQTSINILNFEAEHLHIPVPLTPYLSEFRTRPVQERRAASIHVHVDGDQGPTMGDVAGATLRAFSCLLSQSSGSQVGIVLQAALDCFEELKSWKHLDHCCWFAQKAIDWTQYQYRFAVPTRLMECLLDTQDSVELSAMRKALAAMVKVVFTSATPLVNLSTSDTLSNLTSLLLRRVAIDPDDLLLADLVDCIGALGTHIYYADQIHDLACELIARIAGVDVNGVPGRARDLGRQDRGRIAALRCLISALGKLIRPQDIPCPVPAAKSSEDINDRDETFSITSSSSPPFSPEKTIRSMSPKPDQSNTSPTSLMPKTHHSAVSPHRTTIPPEVWQDTLVYLCDEQFTIRADYARVLVIYIRNELRNEGNRGFLQSHIFADKDKQKDVRVAGCLSGSAAADKSRHRHSLSAVSTSSDSTSRFVNALLATVYVLATSWRLVSPSSHPPSPSRSIDGTHDVAAVTVTVSPSTPLADEPSASPYDTFTDTSQTSQNSRHRLGSQSRKLSLVRRLLELAQAQNPIPSSLAPPFMSHTTSTNSNGDPLYSSASVSDYIQLLSILTAVHEQTPHWALLTSVPLLVALEEWCKCVKGAEIDRQILYRQRAVRELVARTWIAIGELWDLPGLVTLAKAAVSSELNELFTTLVPLDSLFPNAEEPIPLSVLYDNNTEERSSLIDAEAAIELLASSSHVQETTGLEKQSLYKRLGAPWSLDSALKEFDQPSGHGGDRLGGVSPVLKISPALMQVSNLSLQSLARSARGVGVSDLRDALQGRSNASNLALHRGHSPLLTQSPMQRPASISSFGDANNSGESAVTPGLFRPKSRTRALNADSPKEVRDVLDRLGIGARNSANLLKASLSARQKSNTRSMLIPPYKS